jgi:hypothetical protein
MKWCAIFCGAYDNKDKTERTSWFCYGLGYRIITRLLDENKTVVQKTIVECVPPLCVACVEKINRDGVAVNDATCISPLLCVSKTQTENAEKNERIIDESCCCVPCGPSASFKVEKINEEVQGSTASLSPAPKDSIIVEVNEEI